MHPDTLRKEEDDDDDDETDYVVNNRRRQRKNRNLRKQDGKNYEKEEEVDENDVENGVKKNLREGSGATDVGAMLSRVWNFVRARL
jgi:hypothetical protein